MTSIIDNIHPTIIIARLLHYLNTLFSTHGVHPVMISVNKSDVHIFSEICDSVHERQACLGIWLQDMSDAIFARTFGKGNVHNVFVHITSFFVRESGETAR